MGILAASKLGTKDGARPDGKPFNPYQLTDDELAETKRLLDRAEETAAYPLSGL